MLIFLETHGFRNQSWAAPLLSFNTFLCGKMRGRGLTRELSCSGSDSPCLPVSNACVLLPRAPRPLHWFRAV